MLNAAEAFYLQKAQAPIRHIPQYHDICRLCNVMLLFGRLSSKQLSSSCYIYIRMCVCIYNLQFIDAVQLSLYYCLYISLYIAYVCI